MRNLGLSLKENKQLFPLPKKRFLLFLAPLREILLYARLVEFKNRLTRARFCVKIDSTRLSLTTTCVGRFYL